MVSSGRKEKFHGGIRKNILDDISRGSFGKNLRGQLSLPLGLMTPDFRENNFLFLLRWGERMGGGEVRNRIEKESQRGGMERRRKEGNGRKKNEETKTGNGS